jgi:3-oxoacyl-[acyl-carrier protein] reductase
VKESTEGRELDGKIALVTGSSRGLGRGIAIALAKHGCKVFLNYKSNHEAAIRTQNEITEFGGIAELAPADMSIRREVVDLFEKIDREGRLDILVNNAGVNRRQNFMETSDADWDYVLDTNLKGPFIASQEAFRIMENQKYGRIVNISSISGQNHGPKTIHYAVSKAGLNSLTKVLARYGAGNGILVNAVAPGIIPTEQTESELNSAGGRAYLDQTLLKTFGTTDDVAAAVLYLVSKSGDYITGQVISIAGGAYLGS